MTKHSEEGRKPKTLRLTDTEVSQIQAMAEQWGCSWSVAACRLIELGERVAPEEWPPERMPRRRTWRTKAEQDAGVALDEEPSEPAPEPVG